MTGPHSLQDRIGEARPSLAVLCARKVVPDAGSEHDGGFGRDLVVAGRLGRPQGALALFGCELRFSEQLVQPCQHGLHLGEQRLVAQPRRLVPQRQGLGESLFHAARVAEGARLGGALAHAIDLAARAPRSRGRGTARRAAPRRRRSASTSGSAFAASTAFVDRLASAVASTSVSARSAVATAVRGRPCAGRAPRPTARRARASPRTRRGVHRAPARRVGVEERRGALPGLARRTARRWRGRRREPRRRRGARRAPVRLGSQTPASFVAGAAAQRARAARSARCADGAAREQQRRQPDAGSDRRRRGAADRGRAPRAGPSIDGAALVAARPRGRAARTAQPGRDRALSWRRLAHAPGGDRVDQRRRSVSAANGRSP